jgi:spore maturation protein CgeB
MRLVLFCHSLVSDWNHGNAHFLRGVVDDLRRRGHAVDVFEPRDGWSRMNVEQDHGDKALRAFSAAYPELTSITYDLATLDLDQALGGADLVIVHEWTPPELVRRIGEHHRRAGGYALLFHDTHHRAVTASEEMAAYDLSGYDGVLAFGAVLRDLYLARRWSERAWVWHEAADLRRFEPRPNAAPELDLVWIGNWGDEERTAELREYLLEPVRTLGLRAAVYGVRYPESALAELAKAGIDYRGWLPNPEVPDVLARARATVHIPRRPYVERLPGIPTIRVFEALACAIPLVCAPWHDSEGLFEPGLDYLVASSGAEMCRQLQRLLSGTELAGRIAAHGRATIERRHTCAHRTDELLGIVAELQARARSRRSG